MINFLTKLYNSLHGKARYTHALVALIITVLGNFAAIGYEAMIGISTNYWWQEWFRQAFAEARAGQDIKWRDHIEQSLYPTLVSVLAWWLW